MNEVEDYLKGKFTGILARKEWNYQDVDDVLDIMKESQLAELQAENGRLREALIEFGVHDKECILSFWEAGERTEDGGYRTKIKGIWYQSRPVDKTPKCNCGFEQALRKIEEVK